MSKSPLRFIRKGIRTQKIESVTNQFVLEIRDSVGINTVFTRFIFSPDNRINIYES